MEELELKNAPPAERQRALTIAEILRGSEYSLTLFSAGDVASLILTEKNGKPHLMCLATSKLRPSAALALVRPLPTPTGNPPWPDLTGVAALPGDHRSATTRTGGTATSGGEDGKYS